MRNPLVDISMFVGVESLFRNGPRDPWAKALAGKFADLYVYSDQLRYVLPMPGHMNPSEYPGKPQFLVDLDIEESGLLVPKIYDTNRLPYLKEEYLLSTFKAFLDWARANPKKLTLWTALHSENWVREGGGLRVERNYVFDVAVLYNTYKHNMDQLASSLGLGNTELLFYTYDVVLRYPLYGSLAGTNSYYANHPIRGTIRFPGSHHEPAPLAPVCISFEKTISGMANKLSRQQYVQLLRDLREVVRDQGLNELTPGNVEKEVVRGIAQKVKLTPYLKGVSKTAKITTGVTGVIGGLGAISVLGPAAALLGGAVAVTAAVWDGTLPYSLAGARWLRWVLKWEIETQVNDPKSGAPQE